MSEIDLENQLESPGPEGDLEEFVLEARRQRSQKLREAQIRLGVRILDWSNEAEGFVDLCAQAMLETVRATSERELMEIESRLRKEDTPF